MQSERVGKWVKNLEPTLVETTCGLPTFHGGCRTIVEKKIDLTF